MKDSAGPRRVVVAGHEQILVDAKLSKFGDDVLRVLSGAQRRDLEGQEIIARIPVFNRKVNSRSAFG